MGNSVSETTEKTGSKFKDRLQKYRTFKKRLKNMNRASMTCGTASNSVMYMQLESQKEREWYRKMLEIKAKNYLRFMGWILYQQIEKA